MGLLSRAAKGIRAFHGSPHDFDKFELSPRTIGTGEGAQAYGHGLYFADNEAVAKAYRDALSGMSRPQLSGVGNTLGDVDFAVMDAGRNASPDLSQRQLDTFSTNIIEALRMGADPSSVASLAESDSEKRALDAMLRVASQVKPSPAGRVYEVNINAHPDELIHLDRPLSEQGQGALNAVDRALRSKGNTLNDLARQMNASQNPHEAISGAGLLEGLGNRYGSYGDADADVAALLKDNGVAGLRYWDQHSRAPGWRTIPADQSVSGKWVVGQAPSGPNRYFDTAEEAAAYKAAEEAKRSHNYVVFDDSLISILRKYGLPIAAAASGGGLLSRWNQQREINA